MAMMRAPQGSVVAQACHASVAAVWLHRDDPHTAAYCSPDKLDAMHKVRGKSETAASVRFLVSRGR